MKKISVLGSTGSIGTQTLDVIAMHPDSFEVDGLAAGTNTTLLLEQVRRFNPRRVSVATKELADEIRSSLPSGIELYSGNEGLVEVAAGGDAEMVVTAVMGSVGLQSTLAAIEAGKHIGLANKETLVTAGHLVTDLANRKGVKLLPIDSEHSAIYQCLNGENISDIAYITLTASGGSFRDFTRDQLKDVTVEDALRHPNWSMGAKITIDSATMVNKGLEVIEAHWLFGLPYEQVNVLLHPESIIHSYVEFRDSSIIAQLGNPDMRVPIQYALTYPARWESPAQRLSLAEIGHLTFREMDFERYPALKLAIDCGKAGGTATTAFNAANEIAVARFLNHEISFLRIEEIIGEVLDRHNNEHNPNLEQIESCDRRVRELAATL
ncbi:1-deoxy-D-xylulose-5-phosphate reductoisomerase [Paenibacillus odorifer]|nr:MULTISPECIES: 1-deoxy-D-xylulose-5-phosphate reductoisomerase [Paenibacillus]MDH6428171.1 1-deoxy-D-xylulose-5-phosphate reductoisomerase [Paenibacillus sp. PastH-4]MDH6444197.1 1-deoxy-D-xylulose-5-phosphate reductoisomerase [Paenibacillus sp. PastF-4]MDH6528100.1 1-deoxy-D-xylulose-5-phosphate reductoisomerase [Paenibacillus sp. PastH-3]OMD67737.1 1-deoxy-D-xylulose-5-phosphate reductoisomerase [Paenibacillus odorifer]